MSDEFYFENLVSTNSPEIRLGRKSSIFQVLASSSKYLMLLDIGMGVSFATIAIPPLQAATTGLKMTEEEASWFGNMSIS